MPRKDPTCVFGRRAGDLGEQRPDGLLKITGRAREIFKTTKGEYSR